MNLEKTGTTYRCLKCNHVWDYNETHCPECGSTETEDYDHPRLMNPEKTALEQLSEYKENAIGALQMPEVPCLKLFENDVNELFDLINSAFAEGLSDMKEISKNAVLDCLMTQGLLTRQAEEIFDIWWKERGEELANNQLTKKRVK